jgi:hypothetical protein
LYSFKGRRRTASVARFDGIDRWTQVNLANLLRSDTAGRFKRSPVRKNRSRIDRQEDEPMILAAGGDYILMM